MLTKEFSDPISVVLAGIGGYGYDYLKFLLEKGPSLNIELVGAVDPNAPQIPGAAELSRLGIPVFPDLDGYYADGRTADLAVIVTPLHFHVPQTQTALGHGSHVLCEKPAGVTVQEIDGLIRQKERLGLHVEIGFQWSFSQSIQAAKKDILSGRFGRPLRAKTLCFWPRDEAYYRRNSWAGRVRDESGAWILDSPANNAMAHFLHNLLYLLGDHPSASVRPDCVEADLFRVYPIENYDSAACRILTKGGVEVLFYATHAGPENVGPMFFLEFEHAEIFFGESGNRLRAVDRKGSEIDYGSPDDTPHFQKLVHSLGMIQKDFVELCGPEAARIHTLCINGIQESNEIISLPESLVCRPPQQGRRFSRKLTQALYLCYREGLLPSEKGWPWTQRGKTVSLGDYSHFPRGRPESSRR